MNASDAILAATTAIGGSRDSFLEAVHVQRTALEAAYRDDHEAKEAALATLGRQAHAFFDVINELLDVLSTTLKRIAEAETP